MDVIHRLRTICPEIVRRARHIFEQISHGGGGEGEGGGKGVLPYKSLMEMCREIGSHSHD